MKEPVTFHSLRPEETQDIAARLASELTPPAVVALIGELGAGKTCFVQGLACALGVREPVTSPTFTLVNEYAGPIPVAHMDLFRIPDLEQALHFGLDEYLVFPGVTVIEWAERVATYLPDTVWWVRIELGPGEAERIIHLRQGEPL